MTLSIDAKINSFLSMNKWKTTKKNDKKGQNVLERSSFQKNTNQQSVSEAVKKDKPNSHCHTRTASTLFKKLKMENGKM